jgi:hypothetical protein
MEGLKAIMDVLAAGGPTAMAAVFALMWFLERRENRKTQKELLDLAVAQVQANVKMETTMAGLKDVATQALNRMR